MSVTPRSSRKLLNSDCAPSPAVKRTMLDGVGCRMEQPIPPTTPTYAPALITYPLSTPEDEEDEEDTAAVQAHCACDCTTTVALQKLSDLQIGMLKFRMNAAKSETTCLKVRVVELERVVSLLQQAVLQLQEQQKRK